LSNDAAELNLDVESNSAREHEHDGELHSPRLLRPRHD
jgi:hypothetical protein